MRTLQIFLGLIMKSVVGFPQTGLKPKVSTAIYFGRTSEKFIDFKPAKKGKINHSMWEGKEVPNQASMKILYAKGILNLPTEPDPVVQSTMGDRSLRGPIINIDGMGNESNERDRPPADPNGDVGPNHYLQSVNECFQIFNKAGFSVSDPVDNTFLWEGFGHREVDEYGDAIALYDEEADRWLMSQFVLQSYPYGSCYMCIAVSETNDPTGNYYYWIFGFSDLPDYPKFSIWNDGYYLSIAQYRREHGEFVPDGAGAIVFERDQMLVGNPDARKIYFQLGPTDDPFHMLPADYDGALPPPGAPAIFLYFKDNTWGYPTDQLRIWEFSTDWNNLENSTFQQVQILVPASFDSDLCNLDRNCIPQHCGARGLDAISDRLMHRAQYRNFGSYRSIVLNHTVDVGSDHAGIRWYELRSTSNSWSIYQQGTYAPDNKNRWMGSIAMNGFGDIMLGYSVSSNDLYPSIRYTGRLATDPLGEMTLNEETIVEGSGCQTGSDGRWGDYSMMSIDPVDDYTFWYTQEYYKTVSNSKWITRIASFQSVDCESNVVLEDQVIGSPERVTIRSSNTIDVENFTINSGASVDVVAANSIDIASDFNASLGSEFNATIKDCSESYYRDMKHNNQLKSSQIDYTENIEQEFNNSTKSEYEVYPNPTNGLINIDGVANTNRAFIIDVTGKELLERELSDYNTVIDISTYKPGLYFLVIRDQKGDDILGLRIILK